MPQALSGVSEEQALEAFRDPGWRLERLFSIRTRDGSVVKFTPRPQQRTIIEKSTGRIAVGSSSSKPGKSASRHSWESSVRTAYALASGSKSR